MQDDTSKMEAVAASEDSHDEEGVAEVVALDPSVTPAEDVSAGAEPAPTGDAPAPDGAPIADVPEGEEQPPADRTVVIIPSQYALTPQVLTGGDGNQYVELAFGNMIFGGQLYLNRSQLVALGSQMLQLAGLMQAPKDKPAEEAGAVQQPPPGQHDPTARLVGPSGETLVK